MVWEACTDVKVAVVGLDSADWTLLDSWLPHLPHIAEIRREGVSGRLATCKPAVTIPAWKCYSTGKNPGKLGIFWFAYPDFSKRRLLVNLPGDIAGNIWDYVPNALVVNTPGTFPPRTIDGVLIAGFPCPEGLPFATPPWVLQQLPGYRVNSGVPPGEPGFPEEARRLIASRFDAFGKLAPRFHFGQVTVFYIDEMYHLYGSDPVVLDAWRMIDEEIGKIMEFADNVILVSDHGSGPLRHFTNIVPRLREARAFRTRRNPWKALSGVVGKAAHSAPPVARHAAERILPPKLRDAIRNRLEPMDDWLPSAQEQFRLRVDWESPVVPLNQLVYANPNARRGKGSAADAMASLEGLPGVVRIWRKEEIYTGSKVSSAPDFWIEAEPGVEIVARFDEEWETKPPERGKGWIVNHRAEGIFGFWGKDVDPVHLDRASIFDMCPTILAFFNIPRPRDVDGSVLPVIRRGPRGSQQTGPGN